MSNKVTLTGHFTLLDGTPAAGTVLIRPSRSPILDLDGKQVIAGPQRFQLDAEGRFSADLPPTDDPALGEGFTYHVMVTMDHSNWQVIGLTLPAGMVSVDVLDPPAGVVKEYPTRAEWDALTGAAVAEMEAALDEAETARDTTLDARDIAVVARDETLTARDETATARDTAVGAAGDAETARTETFTARDETVEARDATLTARTETITAAGEAESARDTAVGAAGDAETARDEVAGQLAGAPRLTNLVHDITWVTNNSTIGSQTDRTVEFTATAERGFIRWNNTIGAGKSYYFTAEVKATSDQVYFGSGSASARTYHSGSGGWERLTGWVAAGSNLYFLAGDGRSSGWDQIEVRDPVLIDLTEVFGAGREPSKEYMDALLAKHGNYIGAVDQFAVGDALRALTVAGPGMTLRYDTSVGERVFLDHPGGSTMLYGDTGWRDMSSYLPPGVTGTFRVRRRLHATDIKLIVTLTADWQYIGGNTRASTTLIQDLPDALFPNVPAEEASIPKPLFMREGTSGGPTGAASINFQTSTATRMRINSSNSGVWEAGTSIGISGAIPNDRPWPDTLPGTPA